MKLDVYSLSFSLPIVLLSTMRIGISPDYTVRGRSRGNEGMTGYEPKRVRANSTVTTCKQFIKSLVG